MVTTADAVPDGVPEEVRQEAVARLVAEAVDRRLGPDALRRRARRMLAALDTAAADRHQAALLAEQEARRRRHLADPARQPRRHLGGGSCCPTARAPAHDPVAAPRRTARLSRNRAGEPVVDETAGDFPGPSWSESLGAAFCELVEHLPSDGLSSHGRVGAVVAVHVEHERLLDGLGAARLDSGTDISVGEARRLACGAGLLPVVLGGASVPLDLGRTTRLHSAAQRLALSVHHDSCAAEGCRRPFAWTEVHHPHPWSQGGRTDLANALPLCGWHHRRAHDGHYRATRSRRGRCASDAGARSVRGATPTRRDRVRRDPRRCDTPLLRVQVRCAPDPP